MKIDLSAYKKAFQHLPAGIRQAEVNAVSTDITMVNIVGGMRKDCQSSQQTRLYIRSAGEHTGSVCTERMDEDPEKLILQAYENGKYVKNHSPEPMNAGDDFLHVEQAIGGISEMEAFGLALEKEALSIPDVVRVKRNYIRRYDKVLSILNSEGLNRYLENSYFTVELTVELKRTNGRNQQGFAFASCHNLENINITKFARDAVRRGDLIDGGGLVSVPIETGYYDVMLSSQVTDLLLYVIWKEFSGSFIAESASIFTQDIGKKIGSSHLNILDAPMVDKLAYNLSLDAEGTISSERFIVKNGIFCSPLLNLSSGIKLGMDSTGNCGRQNVFLDVRPTILYIAPGEKNTEELLAQMGNGLFITYIHDEIHSINIRSGDFSIPCGGVLYRNGNPVGSVTQLTMVGNIRPLLQNIVEVDNDLYFEEFDLADNYYCGGPGLLIKNLKISC